MLNLLISLLLGTVVGSGLFMINDVHWLTVTLGATLTALGLYYFLSRRVLKQINIVMSRAQQELQGGKINNAIATLKSAYPLDRQQFFLRKQIDSQIGVILYVKRDFAAALPYLQTSFVRNWHSRAMLALIHYRNKEYSKMKKIFEEACKANKDESLLWSVYAYCLARIGKRDEAIIVLSRALEKCTDDPKLKANLTALQNNKKMKMKNYGEAWLQFHLEKIPMSALNKQQHPGRTAFGKGMKRRF